MSWTVFSDATNTGFRGFEEEGALYISTVPVDSGTDRITVDTEGEFALEILKQLGSRQNKFFRSVKASGDLPETLSNFIRYKSDSFEYLEVKEDNIFYDIPNMSDDQKQYFDWLYRNKIELPNLLSINNKIMGILVSAGFVTALVSYSLTVTISLALLSLITIASLIVAITQARTEVTTGEVHTIFKEAVDDTPYVSDDARLYVVPNGLQSPFTMPIGKPAVYFPKSSIGDLTKKEIKTVMEHELGHHKNKTTSGVIFIINVLSGLFIAPILVVLTDLSIDIMFFGLVAALLLIIQMLYMVLGRKDEIVADDQATDRSHFIMALIKLSPAVYHTQTGLQRWVHMLFDVHPPMNKRITNLYPDLTIPDVGKTSWPLSAWMGALLSIIGSALIGYGFLAFTQSNVSELYLFYGTILTLLALIPRYVSDDIFSIIILVGTLVFSFGITVGIGFILGADGIVEAVAVGRLGRRVTFTFIILVLLTVLFLSTLYYDISPDIDGDEDKLRLSTDWEVEESGGHRNRQFYREIYNTTD